VLSAPNGNKEREKKEKDFTGERKVNFVYPCTMSNRKKEKMNCMLIEPSLT